jgi:hypothetical protein
MLSASGHWGSGAATPEADELRVDEPEADELRADEPVRLGAATVVAASDSPLVMPRRYYE